MRKYIPALLSAAPLLLGGCGTFVTDSVIEPYKAESYKLVGDAGMVNGVRVFTEMWPSQNVVYATRGPFTLAITFNVNRDSSKVAAIKSLEVTSGKETLFARDFTSLRTRYFAHDAPGVRNFSRDIDGVRVNANGSLSFGFGKLFQIEHRPGKTITVRATVEVGDGIASETKELVFRHRAKTKRGVWQWYPPT